MDCQAKITVKHLLKFPEYKVPSFKCNLNNITLNETLACKIGFSFCGGFASGKGFFIFRLKKTALKRQQKQNLFVVLL